MDMLRKCIDNMCRGCICGTKYKGTWREVVAMCPITECPLYAVRPVPLEKDDGNGKDGDNATYRRVSGKFGQRSANKRKSHGLSSRAGHKKKAVPKKNTKC